MAKTFGCLLALAAAIAPFPAVAESRSVSIEGLDLTTAKGQARVERRIDQAARMVCGDDTGGRYRLLSNPQTRACIAAAKAGAMRQIARLNGLTIRGG